MRRIGRPRMSPKSMANRTANGTACQNVQLGDSVLGRRGQQGDRVGTDGEERHEAEVQQAGQPQGDVETQAQAGRTVATSAMTWAKNGPIASGKSRTTARTRIAERPDDESPLRSAAAHPRAGGASSGRTIACGRDAPDEHDDGTGGRSAPRSRTGSGRRPPAGSPASASAAARRTGRRRAATQSPTASGDADRRRAARG